MLKNSTQPAGGGNVMYPGKVPGKVKYTFAFGALGKDMIYGMIATFSMIYFTDIIKVAPAFIGIMFFSAKIWDAFNDLFMGMLVDNTRSRFGKFIPWLTVGTLINAFVFIILFTDFHLSGIGLCVFAAVAYVLWGMTYTIMDIPYWSIVPNLTSDPHEREKVSVLPRIFASIGQSLIIAGFGVQIIKGLGGGYTGYHRFALIIAATFIFTIAVTVINLPKKQVGKKAEKVLSRTSSPSSESQPISLLGSGSDPPVQRGNPAHYGCCNLLFCLCLQQQQHALCIYDQCLHRRSGWSDYFPEGHQDALQKESIPASMYSSGNRTADPAAHRYFCTAEHCAHCHCRRDRQDWYWSGTGLCDSLSGRRGGLRRI